MIKGVRQCIIAAGRARVVVLLAALLLAGSPALEAIHDHASGAAYADCLLCKQADATALPAITHPVLERESSRVFAPATRPQTQPQRYRSFSPRGPPTVP